MDNFFGGACRTRAKHDNVWVDRDVKVGSGHEGDIFCGFDLDTEKGESKKLLEDYGFILEDVEDGFWITGVKE